MKIQSISDIITNSSSEVFTIYSEESISAVKELVNSILELSGNEKKFDDYFTIDYDFDEYYLENLESANPEIKDKESLKERARQDYEDSVGNGERSWAINGILVTAKDPKNENVAKLIQNIENIFETEELYC